jgi:pyruvate/2-oxoglutarate dehydrogenase complex dihydrolipoamide acyltransferase (E2) component
MSDGTFTAKPFPAFRQLVIDGMEIASRKHWIHGLIEVDVTQARQRLAEMKEETGESFSFTGFIIYCCAKAVDENKDVHAYRDWRNRLIVFDDVDVSMLRNVGCYTLIPAFARHRLYRLLHRAPHLVKKMSGTVMVTAVGMFGQGAGWGIALPGHTLAITIGGIVSRPVVHNAQLENREHLCLTISFDHDIIDGAPAARFTQRFKELVESGSGLFEQVLLNN